MNQSQQTKPTTALSSVKDAHLTVSDNASYTALQAVREKLQKIATATYMLTDLLPENEALKSRLRTSMIDSLAALHTATTLSLKDTHYNLDMVKYGLQEFVSYLDIAYSSKFFSDMNYKIMHTELNKVSELLGNVPEVNHQKSTSSVDSLVSLKDVFGAVPQPEPTQQVVKKTTAKKPLSHKSPLQYKKEAVEVKESTEEVVKIEHPLNQKDMPIFVVPKKTRTPFFKKSDKVGTKKTLRQSKPNDVKIARKEKIISILTARKDVSINDITDQFEGISSKTIQRDLGELIDEMKVSKQGSRRWSTYNLVA